MTAFAIIANVAVAVMVASMLVRAAQLRRLALQREARFTRLRRSRLDADGSS